MKTEDEARKCWCPFARFGAVSEAHLPVHKNEGFHCVAAKCMAWRWIDSLKISYPNLDGKAVVELPQSDWRGFCGLAGKP